MHRIPALLLSMAMSLSLLAACAASPAFEQAASAPAQPSQPPKPAPRMSDPLPPERVGSAPKLDYSCKTSADCAVKNVGNCCGMMPACVNKDSPVDPAAVRAQCAKSGMMSVCGFREISACQCNAGRCEDASGPMRLPRKPAQPSTPVR